VSAWQHGSGSVVRTRTAVTCRHAPVAWLLLARLAPNEPDRRLSDIMTDISTAGLGGRGTTTQGPSLPRGAATGAAIAIVVNAALWAAGRAVDASFLVTLPMGDTERVGIVEVAVKTLLAFAVGSGVLALAARRSRRWVRAVLVAVALFAVLSAVGPATAAHDAATGVLLVAMHVVAGATFLVTASRVAASPA